MESVALVEENIDGALNMQGSGNSRAPNIIMYAGADPGILKGGGGGGVHAAEFSLKGGSNHLLVAICIGN
jgi:hypothetical protein